MKNLKPLSALLALAFANTAWANDPHAAPAAAAPAKPAAAAPAAAEPKAAMSPAEADDALRRLLAERMKSGGDLIIKSNEMAKPAAGAHGAAPAAAGHGAADAHGAPAKPKARVAKKKEPAHEEHAAHAVHWSYEGEGGPANWGSLAPENALCDKGLTQSPIDIKEGIKVDLPAIKFDYKPSQFRIVDNGHTIQVTPGEDSFITVQGKQYQLLQFHFHKPSEERINGKSYELVAHLVHKNEEGRLAVVAVLFEKGAEHGLIQTLWDNLPLVKNETLSPEAPIDINQMLPEARSYFTYMGSLTTPPCTEGVLWLVLKSPVQVSAEQLTIFSRLYKMNARPIQKANARLIKESR